MSVLHWLADCTLLGAIVIMAMCVGVFVILGLLVMTIVVVSMSVGVTALFVAMVAIHHALIVLMNTLVIVLIRRRLIWDWFLPNGVELC